MATWVWPVPSTASISSQYGPRWDSTHKGIDIAASQGSQIVASREGVVSLAYNGCTHNYGKNYPGCGCGGNYGNNVYIDHGGGFQTRYAHMTDVYVKYGQRVVQGQVIGTVGSTGWSTGPHLHFEVRQNDYPQNPLNYVDPSNTKIVNTGITNKLTQFLNLANSKVGTDGYWTWSVSGLGQGEAWCAAFVVACAKTVGGLLNIVIPNSFNCGDMIIIGIRDKLGTWIRGKHLTGRSVTPIPGDLLFKATPGGTTEYSAQHVAIVKEVKSGIVYAVAGNSETWDNYTSKVKVEQYGIERSDILGYFRPNWAKVGGFAVGAGGQLYAELNTREDGIIREVGYLDDKYQPSINSSNIKLSILNYTTTMAELFSSGLYNFPGIANVMFAANIVDSSLSDAQVSVANQVYSLLQSKGLNAAACIGILGNMYYESSFNPGTSYITATERSYGLCQWNEAAGRSVRRAVGPDWATNISGQIDFLWSELEGMTGLKSFLDTVPVTESGAMDAAEKFVRIFERPDRMEYNVSIRRAKAKEYWNCNISTLT